MEFAAVCAGQGAGSAVSDHTVARPRRRAVQRVALLPMGLGGTAPENRTLCHLPRAWVPEFVRRAAEGRGLGRDAVPGGRVANTRKATPLSASIRIICTPGDARAVVLIAARAPHTTPSFKALTRAADVDLTRLLHCSALLATPCNSKRLQELCPIPSCFLFVFGLLASPLKASCALPCAVPECAWSVLQLFKQLRCNGGFVAR
eukprot:gene12435-biopygen18482